MNDKEIKNYAEAISKSVIVLGMAGLLLDAFKGFMKDAKECTAKELEEAMKKLEDK